MIETRKSFCRFCHVFCGVEVDVEDDRVLAVRGDKDNAVSRGYTCPKGRAEVERIHHPDRVLMPRKRVGEETIDIAGIDAGLTPRAELGCRITRADGSVSETKLLCRIDTADELAYFNNGGILHYVLRDILKAA